jgi:hypothetical protein
MAVVKDVNPEAPNTPKTNGVISPADEKPEKRRRNPAN